MLAAGRVFLAQVPASLHARSRSQLRRRHQASPRFQKKKGPPRGLLLTGITAITAPDFEFRALFFAKFRGLFQVIDTKVSKVPPKCYVAVMYHQLSLLEVCSPTLQSSLTCLVYPERQVYGLVILWITRQTWLMKAHGPFTSLCIAWRTIRPNGPDLNSNRIISLVFQRTSSLSHNLIMLEFAGTVASVRLMSHANRRRMKNEFFSVAA